MIKFPIRCIYLPFIKRGFLNQCHSSYVDDSGLSEESFFLLFPRFLNTLYL